MLTQITKWCVIEKTDKGTEEILNAFSKKERAEEMLKQVLEARKKDLESENPFWYDGTENWEYYVAEKDVMVFTEDED